MRTKNKVIAIACGDLHLSHKPPICRAIEPDWYAAMGRVLAEIQILSDKNNNAPILCAGDVFDRWNPPAELVNWAILNMPIMYAIPGQHDLPQHNYDEMHRTAFATLVLSDVLMEIDRTSRKRLPVSSTMTHCWGFPWGFPVKLPRFETPKNKGAIRIALAHEYNWIPDHSYPGAPKEQRISKKRKALMDFDVVIFGDNHKGFLTKIGNTTIFNCGTLMRRKTDEADYKPWVGLIHSDASVTPHYLDISKDKLDLSKPDNVDPALALDVEEFLSELDNLSVNPLDFCLAVERYVTEHKNLSIETAKTLLEAIRS